MTMVHLEELKALYLDMMDEYRERSKHLAVLPPAYTGAILVMSATLKWIADQAKNTGDNINMAQLKTEIQTKLVSLDEIPRRDRDAQRENEIKQHVTQLVAAVEDAKKKGQPLPALRVEGGIKYPYLATKISKMKKEGTIPKEVRVLSRNNGQEFYLAMKA